MTWTNSTSTNARHMPCGPTSGCRQCGQPLSGRRTAYCSETCRWSFEANHFWPRARITVLARNRKELANATEGRQKGARTQVAWCAHCKRSTSNPEVNHIVPVNGRRESWSCANHQTNLNV